MDSYRLWSSLLQSCMDPHLLDLTLSFCYKINVTGMFSPGVLVTQIIFSLNEN